MTKIIRISSEDNVKYVTFEKDADFDKSFQECLSDIGVARDKRKNLYKDRFIYARGGITSINYKNTLQVIHNKDKTINIEIFTGSSTVIVVINHINEHDDVIIGKALEKHFKFKSS